ncbi:hypothetical protein GJ496_006003 [Pomphorhynchus laevis]|nr:hypothetical protein GJ496_006003 [Pomphorhynchus laevis]
MTNVLKTKNLWKYLGGIKSQDDETAEDDAQKKQLALTTIIMSINTEFLYLVRDVEDPAEVWKILNERFDSKSMGHVLNLNRRLFCCKMKTDSLSAVNARVEESQQIAILLNSVSDTFSPAVTALSASEDKYLTMSLVQSTLLAEEERIEQKKLRTTNSLDYMLRNMTYERNVFHSLNFFDKAENVYLGDDRNVSAIGQGTVIMGGEES